MYREDHRTRPGFQTEPPIQEVVLREDRMEAEGCTFSIGLRQNFRGRFLRITQKAGPDFACLIVPAPGLPDFTAALGQIANLAKQAVSRGCAPANPIQVQIERKCFEFVLSLDQNGWFLVILEQSRGNSSQLIVPLSVLDPFTQLIGEMTGMSQKLPPILAEGEDETLKFGGMQFADRDYKFLLKKNHRGVFLRITEAKDGYVNSIIVPEEILAQFTEWVVGMTEVEKKPKKRVKAK